jgi:branched-chain amino acid transport system substrate-binding protein
VANRFVADGAKYVIGHSFSSITIPASDIYAEGGILMVTPAASNPAVTERGRWNVFRTCGRDDQQGAVAGAYLGKAFSGKKLAVVHDETAYGKGLVDETKKAANKAGLTEAMYEGINPGEKDYSALISKMKAANIDVVYYGGLYTEAGLIIRQMRDQGLKAVMMSGDGLVSNEFWQIAGPGAAGTVVTFHPDPKNRPEARISTRV